MKLLAGNSNPALAAAIGQYLKLPFTKAVVRRFADMDISGGRRSGQPEAVGSQLPPSPPESAAGAGSPSLARIRPSMNWARDWRSAGFSWSAAISCAATAWSRSAS